MDLHEVEPARDRRVRRTRAAVLRAAFDVVTAAGTTAVTLSDIAEAADVSRRVVYQHFGDLDAVLLETGLDLVRRELLPRIAVDPQVDVRALTLATVRHFADHRVFYRALLTGSCAFALDRGLITLFLPVNRLAVEQVYGDRLTRQAVDDVAAFITGGVGAFITAWVTGSDDPLDPEAFTDRLLDVTAVLMEPR